MGVLGDLSPGRPPQSMKGRTVMAKYENVTTKLVVEDTSGRLDGLARWRRLPDEKSGKKATAPADAPKDDEGTGGASEATEADTGADTAAPAKEKTARSRKGK